MLFSGPHQFWIMSYENRMISLKTLFIQTSPKSLILVTEATRNGLNYPIIFPSLEHKIWHMKSFKFVRKNLSKSFKHFGT